MKNWITATLPGFVRLMLIDAEFRTPLWPLVLIPGLSAAAVLGVLVFKQPRIDWSKAFPALTALSVFTAPYGWSYDFSVLLPLQVSLALKIGAYSNSAQRIRGALLLLTPNIALAAFFFWGAHWEHQFFWYPGAMLLVWFLEQRTVRAAGRSEVSQKPSKNSVQI